MAKNGKWKKLLGHLKGVVPGLVGIAGTAIGGPAAGGVLATIARQITGSAEDLDLDDVASKLFADPASMIEMEKLAIERERNEQESIHRRLTLQLEQQKVVAATMKAEFEAEDPYVRRWRPTFGYVAAYAFGIQATGVTYLLCTGGSPALITAFAGLTGIWAPAMAVLGITSWTRGKEKQARAVNK